ncbi:MAG: type II secretion system protein [Rickettsiales bacterium]|nr:type II secretion system protein [Rickettsiales bacterium]
MKNSKKGFTIIELVIVLVIVALIITGILGGQYLIEISRMQTLSKEITQYAALHTRFQEQYKQLPGDMDNAFTIWGTNCANTSARCNGTGNLIYDNQTETYKAWKHFELSKILDTTFTAITADSHADCEVGNRYPKLSLDGISFGFISVDNDAESSTSTTSYSTSLMRISSVPLSCSNLGKGLLTGDQIKFIDEKIDDGFAYSGKVITSQSIGDCTDSAADEDDANYVSGSKPECVLWYILKTF